MTKIYNYNVVVLFAVALSSGFVVWLVSGSATVLSAGSGFDELLLAGAD